MEKYIDNGVERFIDSVASSTQGVVLGLDARDCHIDNILSLFYGKQLIFGRTIDGWKCGYALLDDGRLLNISYYYNEIGGGSIALWKEENGAKCTFKPIRVAEQPEGTIVRLFAENGEPIGKPILRSDLNVEINKPLGDIIEKTISVEDMKDRGIIRINDDELANPVIHELLKHILEANTEDNFSCYDSRSMEESQIDSLFRGNQLLSLDTQSTNMRWAFIEGYRILSILCVPVGNQYSYIFQLKYIDEGQYLADEQFDGADGTFWSVRSRRDKKPDNTIRTVEIKDVIKPTSVNQLMVLAKEMRKGQYGK